MSVRSLLLAAAGNSTTVAPTGLWYLKSSGVSAKSETVAFDSSGNAYMCAINSGSNPDSYAFKFDANGNVLWQMLLPNFSAYSIAVDSSSGNVYCCGCVSDIITSAVVALNSSGAKLWAKTYTISSAQNSGYIKAATVSASGHLHASGMWLGPGASGSSDGMLLKIDSTGALVWSLVYGGANFDFVQDVKCDSSNNVHFTIYDFTSRLSTLYKLNSSGSYLWGIRSSTTSTGDRGIGLGIDSSGNVYYASQQHNLTKVNSSGTKVWSKTLSIYNQSISSIVTDASGNSYVSVMADSDDGGSQLYKRDTSGNLLWMNLLVGNNISTGTYISTLKADINGTNILHAVYRDNNIALLKVPTDGTKTKMTAYNDLVYRTAADTDSNDASTFSSASITIAQMNSYAAANLTITPTASSVTFTNTVIT